MGLTTNSPFGLLFISCYMGNMQELIIIKMRRSYVLRAPLKLYFWVLNNLFHFLVLHTLPTSWMLGCTPSGHLLLLAVLLISPWTTPCSFQLPHSHSSSTTPTVTYFFHLSHSSSSLFLCLCTKYLNRLFLCLWRICSCLPEELYPKSKRYCSKDMCFWKHQRNPKNDCLENWKIVKWVKSCIDTKLEDLA